MGITDETPLSFGTGMSEAAVDGPDEVHKAVARLLKPCKRERKEMTVNHTVAVREGEALDLNAS